MNYLTILILYLATSTLSAPGMQVTAGVVLTPPPGFYSYNFAPTLNSTENSEIYDPNFIPGFHVGLTNVSLTFHASQGYASVGYSVGPWQHIEVSMPHMAVGPQCCNFLEVPRTQQFRAQDWGDYYYVRAGFSSPAVNMANYTANFTAPAYVGLRTDWQWVVSMSLNWDAPKLLNPSNEWSTLGIAATQYVPSAPKKLIYTVVDFWMDPNSTKVLRTLPSSANNRGVIVSPQIVVYPSNQLSQTSVSNQTITIDLSGYLRDTLDTLGFANATGSPPVVSYVYLNIEGYNVAWNTTLYSFFVMTDHSPALGPVNAYPTYLLLVPLVCVAAGGLLVYLRVRRRSLSRTSG